MGVLLVHSITLYGTYQGNRLFYGTNFLPIRSSVVPDGTTGYFMVEEDFLGFRIVDVITQ